MLLKASKTTTSIYISGVILCGAAVKIILEGAAYQTEALTKMSLLIVCTLIAMPTLHKLINWILLHSDNKDRWHYLTGI